MLTPEQQQVLQEIIGSQTAPEGAYNIRVDGGSAGARSTKHIEILRREDGQGLTVRVAPGTKDDRVHIPVIISADGHVETVYNDFFIGEGADVTIVAGCGIHNCGAERSQHDGIHTFHVAQGARVRYIEKHIGMGEGTGENVMNPVTIIRLGKDAQMEIETVQIRGVDSTRRETEAELSQGASLVIREKLMTHGRQRADTLFRVRLDGEGSSANVVSRSVARNDSTQEFLSVIDGNAPCKGHSECDAIIMDSAKVRAVPEITAHHVDASLIHEAAIGKIAGEQIVKLRTLGLTEEEAEERIVEGFLK